MIISLHPALHGNPIMAFLESLISRISKGIITGKLKTAIRVDLLLALDAIADVMLKVKENPILPNITATRYMPMFSMGLFNITVKNKRQIKERIISNAAL